jgi:hypothetical protein
MRRSSTNAPQGAGEHQWFNAASGVNSMPCAKAITSVSEVKIAV